MTSQLNMEYNSQADILRISEYGRNVQNLIMHCKTIEDKEHRQAFAERIIKLMWQMNPTSGVKEDITRKFWTHLMIIADYDLDVELPEGIELIKNETKEVDLIGYPERNRRKRHYGKNVQLMLEKAMTIDDPAKQKSYLRIIGSFMKLAYRNWSREQYITDAAVKNDIKALTDNKLDLPEDLVFDIAPPVQKKKKQNSQGGKRNNNRSKGRNNQNRKRRY